MEFSEVLWCLHEVEEVYSVDFFRGDEEFVLWFCGECYHFVD